MQASQAMNESSTLVSSTSFDALLDSYLQTSLRCSLSELRQQTLLVPEEMRLRAWHLLSYALRTGKAWQETREILTTLAPKMEQAGYWDDWIPFLQKGILESQIVIDVAAEARFRFELGFIMHLRSHFVESYEAYERSAVLFESIGDYRSCATALNRQAFSARLRRHYDVIPQLIDQAMSYLAEDDPERAASYHVLGWLALDQNENSKAEAYFRDALALDRRTDNQRKIAHRLRDLGIVLYAQQQFAESIKFYQESHDLFVGLGDQFESAVVLMNIGVVRLVLDDADTAIACFTTVEPIFTQLQAAHHLAKLYNNLGIGYRLVGDLNTSKTYHLKSITIFEKVGDIDEIVNVMTELAQTNHQLGQLTEAESVLQQAQTVLQQMRNSPSYQRRMNDIISQLKQMAVGILGDADNQHLPES